MCSIAVLESVFNKLETSPTVPVSEFEPCLSVFTFHRGAAACLFESRSWGSRCPAAENRVSLGQNLTFLRNKHLETYQILLLSTADDMGEEGLISWVLKADFCSLIFHPATDSSLCCLYCNIAYILFHPCTNGKRRERTRVSSAVRG